MKLRTDTNGLVGLDCNIQLTTAACDEIKAANFDFVLRYIGRVSPHTHDLAVGEVSAIINSGLGLMPVQHVESESAWIPSAQKGREYGAAAVEQCKQLGIAEDTSVWLDLEGVEVNVPPSIIIDYCNQWYAKVIAGRFLPGLYIGWHSGLNRHDLYYKLKFQSYWAAYNLNADETPLVRGVQMRQKVASVKLPYLGIEYQRDTINTDALGGLPVMMVAG